MYKLYHANKDKTYYLDKFPTKDEIGMILLPYFKHPYEIRWGFKEQLRSLDEELPLDYPVIINSGEDSAMFKISESSDNIEVVHVNYVARHFQFPIEDFSNKSLNEVLKEFLGSNDMYSNDEDKGDFNLVRVPGTTEGDHITGLYRYSDIPGTATIYVFKGFRKDTYHHNVIAYLRDDEFLKLEFGDVRKISYDPSTNKVSYDLNNPYVGYKVDRDHIYFRDNHGDEIKLKIHRALSH